MHSQEYFLAADCPNCGQKDERNAWKGARMSSSRWGHDYACCSEKCGVEFLNSKNHKAIERRKLKTQIDMLHRELKKLS